MGSPLFLNYGDLESHLRGSPFYHDTGAGGEDSAWTGEIGDTARPLAVTTHLLFYPFIYTYYFLSPFKPLPLQLTFLGFLAHFLSHYVYLTDGIISNCSGVKMCSLHCS